MQISLRQWIREKLSENNFDNSTLYKMFAVAQKDTATKLSYDNYKREVRLISSQLRNGETINQHQLNKDGTISVTREEAGPNLNIVTTSSEIRTLEQLLAYTKVDLNEYEVTKHTVNSWGSNTNENFQVKAWLRKKEASELDIHAEIELLKEDAKKHAYNYKKINYTNKSKRKNLVEITLFDHHFGQLSWGLETGSDNYDVNIASKLLKDSINYFLSNIDTESVDKFLLPIGNDFFNVNGSNNATFAGTPQSEDDRYKKTFVQGRKLWVDVIEQLMDIAPVDVIIVPGNHDEERTFYLGDSLECWFDKSKDVNIDNGPKLRKYYRYGNSLIMFTHGDKEVRGTYPGIMAAEQPKLWADTLYREVHMGHLHHAKNSSFQIIDEFHGVRTFVLPSLVASDDWHASKGYSSLRESTTFVFDKEKGKISTLYYKP